MVVQQVADQCEEAPAITSLLDSAADELHAVVTILGTQPFYRDDADTAITRLYKPLSLIEGGVELARGLAGDPYSHSLQSVHDLLDEAQDNLEARELTALLPKGDVTARDYMRGKALGALLGQAALNRPQATETDINASSRPPGVAQVNLAATALVVLAADDRLFDGFTSALTCILTESVEHAPLIEDIARLSHSACTEFWEFDEDHPDKGRIGVSLDEQVALYGLGSVFEPAATNPTPGAARGAEASQNAPAESHAATKFGTTAERLELARQACLEIQKLAEAMQIVNAEHRFEEHPITHGIMARIIVLSEIVFNGAELHGDDPENFGSRPLEDLMRYFKGAM